MPPAETHQHEPMTWLPTTTCILWGLLCMGLYFSGLLVLVQRRLFSYFTLSAGIFLLLLGAAKYLFGTQQAHSAHACGHPIVGKHRFWSKLVRVGVLLAPILGGLLLQGDGLGVLAARKRGVLMDPQTIMKRLKQRKELRTQLDQEYRYAEVTGIYSILKESVGTKVATTGFVYRGKEIPPGCFAVVRFYIWCCAADAQAVSVLVKSDKTEKLTDEQWVKVYGVLREHPMGKQKIPLIEADRIELCNAPGNPYLE